MSDPAALTLPEPPRRYCAPRVDRPVSLTGRLDDPLWALAPWTEDFLDILGAHAPKPRHWTRAKMLWGPEYLTIGAVMEEPQVWATKTEHDSVIFEDNDFEIFIDPDCDGHVYAEIEVNALNTTWDLLLVAPYRSGGPAINGWEAKGMKTAVHVDGVLNDPTHIDRGWSVEVAIPWAVFHEIARCECPPRVGDVWGINFSRVQWQSEVIDGRTVKVANQPEDNWVWSPMGVVDMHRPLRWGRLEFGDAVGQSAGGEEDSLTRRTLVALHDAQLAYRGRTGQWASTTTELGLADMPGLTIQTTRSLLEMSLDSWSIDHESKLRRLG